MNYIDEVRIKNLSLELEIKNKKTLDEQIGCLCEYLKNKYQIDSSTQKDLIDLRLLTDKDDHLSVNMPLRYMHPDEKYHTHHTIELIYIVSGEVEIKIDGKSNTYKNGQVLLINQNCLHAESYLKKDDCMIYIKFGVDYFKTIINQISNFKYSHIQTFIKSISNTDKVQLVFTLDRTALYDVHEDISLLYKEYDLSRTSYEIIRDGLIIRILNILFESENYQCIKNKTAASQENIFYNIDRYLHKNYAIISKVDVCEQFHISPDYLNKIIIKNKKMSFTSYLTDIKLKNSLILLKNQELSISEIATTIGYDNINYFYKVFKKKFQTTPKQFRENFIENSH